MVLQQKHGRYLPALEAANKKRVKFFDKDLFNWQQGFVLDSFYATLFALRRSSMAIQKGECFLLPTGNEAIGFFRKNANETILVLLNVSTTHKQIIAVEHEWLNGAFKSIFSGVIYNMKGTESFELMPGEYLICVSKK
jgi:glycosidase